MYTWCIVCGGEFYKFSHDAPHFCACLAYVREKLSDRVRIWKTHAVRYFLFLYFRLKEFAAIFEKKKINPPLGIYSLKLKCVRICTLIKEYF